MIPKIQNFFMEIQQSGEDTKKRWLFILSGSSMFIVLILWIFYINLTVKSLQKEDVSLQNNTGVFSIFKNGIIVLSKESGLNISKLTDYLKDFLSKKNSVTIQGANFNFIVNGLEDVKPKKLP
jgi:hypothetical protein